MTQAVLVLSGMTAQTVQSVHTVFRTKTAVKWPSAAQASTAINASDSLV